MRDDQKSLIIMDTDVIHKLCQKNNCIIVIVPHNLTNVFQPLEISVNRSAKNFLTNQYNQWFSERVAAQLSRGKEPCDVKDSFEVA